MLGQSLRAPSEDRRPCVAKQRQAAGVNALPMRRNTIASMNTPDDPVVPSQPDEKDCGALPSKFYGLLLGAQEFRLQYPVDSTSHGPWLQPDGSPAPRRHLRIDTAEVEAVHVGYQRFRLASAPPTWFGGFQLRWGDLFRADRERDELTFIRLELPREFVHYDLDRIGARGPGVRVVAMVHEFGGGWETQAGVSSLAVPTERSSEFEDELTRLGESFQRTD